jgi:hypothetical protein
MKKTRQPVKRNRDLEANNETGCSARCTLDEADGVAAAGICR